MTRASPILTTFNAGEWSPLLHGRVDLAKYHNAVQRLENMIPLPQGPATRRPGTAFVSGTREDQPARLIPFEFSTLQAYVIAATDGVFRFFRDGGAILDGEVPYEVATPYAEADLAGLKWAQSADLLYLCHPAHAPHVLSRTGHTAWSLDPLAPVDGPYLEMNAGPVTLTPSATSGTVTLTASAALFAAGDVGRAVRLRHSGTWGWARITAVSGATSATAAVQRTLGGTGATPDWRLGAWSAATGWPGCVTFFEDRLCFAASTRQPNTIWMSGAGDYTGMAPSEADGTVAADNAITLTISDDRVNAVRWLSAGKVLIAGTVGGEFVVRASALNEAVTPDNATVRRETTIGSADQMPVRIGGSVLFVQRAGRRLHELSYTFEVDNFVAPDVTLLAEHLVRPGLRQLAYQQQPWSVLWGCLDDGGLVGMTYLPQQEVAGWHRHMLGGREARVLSLACIPGPVQDELWLVVQRQVGSGEGATTRRFVERLEPAFHPAHATDTAAARFLDCALAHDGAPATVLSGLDHLEGEAVGVLADGAAHPPRVVEGGQVTLQRPAGQVLVGLAYASLLESLDLEAGAADGTAQARRKRIHRVAVRLLETLGARVGFAEGALDTVLFRSGSDPMDSAPPLFSGDRIVTFPKGWGRAARIVVAQDQPLPLTVAALVAHLTTGEG